VKRKKVLLFTSILVLVILITGAFFYIRSPFMSNHLKRIILPELSRVSGQRVTAKRIYINLFPFFAGVDNLLVSDKEGGKTLSIKKMPGFILNFYRFCAANFMSPLLLLTAFNTGLLFSL